MHPKRRWIRLTLVVLVCLAVAAPTAAQQLDEDDQEYLEERLSGDRTLQERQAEAADVASRRSELAGELGSLQATDAEIQARIDALEVEIAETQQRYDDAYAAQLDSIRRSVAVQQDLDAAEAEVARHQERLAEAAVEGYIRPKALALSSLLAADDPNEAKTKVVYLGALAEAETDVVKGLRSSEARLAQARGEFDALEEEADLQRREARAAKEELDVARAEQYALKAELEARIDAYEAEVAALAAAEAELQGIIQARQASIVQEAQVRAANRDACEQGDQPVDASGQPVDCSQFGLGQPEPTAAPAPSGLVWPANGWVSSEFGMRWGRMHQGIDIAADTGAPIWAAAGGTVFYAGWIGGYGNTVLIDHGGGLATLYGHMSAIYVSDGQSVGQGEGVGAVGSTGNSTGPHLHFETRVNGAQVNPRQYLG